MNDAVSKTFSSNERYLCFSLGEEEYAVPLLSVKEVIALPEITGVPQTPAHCLGITNLRGQVITVMDLRSKLSIKASQESDTVVIICDLKPNTVGVVVDSINSVINPSAEQMSTKPEIQAQRNTDYIQAVYREKARMVLVLDMAKALGLGEQSIGARATERKAA